MAAKNMSNCFLCGAEYEVCKMCTQVTQYTPWRKECDTARHWQIYMVVKDFRKGILKADEAKSQLNHLKVTISEIKTFVPSVQDTLLPLYEEKKSYTEERKSYTKENTKSNKAAKKAVVADEAVKEEVVEEITEVAEDSEK